MPYKISDISLKIEPSKIYIFTDLQYYVVDRKRLFLLFLHLLSSQMEFQRGSSLHMIGWIGVSP